MWHLYVEGHGLCPYTDWEELEEVVKEWLKSHHPEAIVIIEGKDITDQVLSNLE